MKTNKRGISLIVLVITVIVLGILASAVIISVNSTNLIQESDEKVEKYNVKQYESQLSLAYASWLMENEDGILTSIVELQAYGFDATVLPARYTAKVVDGVPVVTTVTVVPDTMQVGDVVAYTPDKSANQTISGPNYVNGTETTKDYQPGNMKWVYLGQDTEGNVLLISQDATLFTMDVSGVAAWINGPDRMDTLCNTLYGSNTYGKARNLKTEDVDRVLGYNGRIGHYTDVDGAVVNITEEAMLSIGAIERATGITVPANNRKVAPDISDLQFENVLSNTHHYNATSYMTSKPKEYQVIFKKADGSYQPMYGLSSSSAYLGLKPSAHARYRMDCIYNGEFSNVAVSDSVGIIHSSSFALRPVIVLNSNIQFGAKNTAGAWTLTVME